MSNPQAPIHDPFPRWVNSCTPELVRAGCIRTKIGGKWIYSPQFGAENCVTLCQELKLVMSPGVSTHSKTPRQDKGSATAVEPVVEVLTQREFEVLKLMADGLTTKAIAHTLGTSFKTAACHRSHILDKIGVGTTVSAVRWAIRKGLIEP